MKKDSGGWILLESVPEYFENAFPHNQTAINEYRHQYGHLFGSPLDCKIGAHVALWTENRGNRLSLLMAIKTTTVNGRVV